MPKSKILVQLDTDAQPSVFDSVVAIDSGVDQLLRQHGITPDNVAAHVHGAIFTRGVDDLKSTALFVGGADVAAGEAVLKAIRQTFFGPMRVSVLLDSNGCNTTAAAAVVCAAGHVPLAGATALVLGGTGPVGQRVARLLAGQGARVRVASRRSSRADEVCQAIGQFLNARDGGAAQSGVLEPAEIASHDQLRVALADCQIVVAAGAAGVCLLPRDAWSGAGQLRVAIDLNAVPPLGIEAIEVFDRAADRDGVAAYGAIGVGGLKMKIHRRAIKRLFAQNDCVLDAEEVFQIGQQL